MTLYCPKVDHYHKATREYAIAKKGRVMADVAIDWVADQLRQMLELTDENSLHR